MKRVLLVLCLNILFIYSMFGQERVNGVRPKYSKVSGILTMATGWSYNNSLEEWIDYKNLISNDKYYKERGKILPNGEIKSHSVQNFNWIQTKLLEIDNTEYYCLLVNQYEGEWKYPTIMEDWEFYQVILCYVFDKDEYEKILNLSTEIIEVRSFNFLYLKSQYFTDTESDGLARIKKIVKDRSPKEKYIHPSVFRIRLSHKGAVRFLLPNFLRDNGKDKINFDQNYFETTDLNFSKIIIKK